MSLSRHLGVSYPTALMLHHKIMHAMGEREKLYVLSGQVQIDDSYLLGNSLVARLVVDLRTKCRSQPPFP
jgi:hypothetical protein